MLNWLPLLYIIQPQLKKMRMLFDVLDADKNGIIDDIVLVGKQATAG